MGEEFVAVIVMNDTASGGGPRPEVVGCFGTEEAAITAIEQAVDLHMKTAFADVKDIGAVTVTRVDCLGRPTKSRAVRVNLETRAVAR